MSDEETSPAQEPGQGAEIGRAVLGFVGEVFGEIAGLIVALLIGAVLVAIAVAIGLFINMTAGLIFFFVALVVWTLKTGITFF